MSAPDRQRAPQERAEATKEKLLTATLAVILREGWSGASTLKICQEAAVSNGAQTHHFPRKNDLLIAALQRNRDELRARSARRMARRSESSVPIREFMEHLDLTKQDEAYYYATLESLIAARTDATLKEDVRAIDAEWIETLRSMARERIEEGSADGRAEDIAELTLYLIRGLVVQRGLHESPGHLKKMFGLWCDLVERAVASGDAQGPRA